MKCENARWIFPESREHEWRNENYVGPVPICESRTKIYRKFSLENLLKRSHILINTCLIWAMKGVGNCYLEMRVLSITFGFIMMKNPCKQVYT